MADFPEAIVINADAGWNFSSLVRSHALDLYDPKVRVQLWNFDAERRDPKDPVLDRAFWGTWPIPTGEGASGIKASIGDTLTALRRDQKQYLSVICVVDVADLETIHKGETGHSAAFDQLISVLRHLEGLLQRMSRGEHGVSVPVRSRLWVTIAIRKGGNIPGAPGEWLSTVVQKLNADMLDGAALIEGLQFLSISADEDDSSLSNLTHFRKLRVLVDITRQNRRSVRREDHDVSDLWRYFRQAATVHQLHLDEDFVGAWSDSDLLRLTLVEWYRQQKTRVGTSLYAQVDKLKSALEELKQQTQSNPAYTEEDTREVLDRVQDRLDSHYKDYDPARLDIENGTDENGAALWPDLGRFMVYRSYRLDWLEQVSKDFKEHLKKYHTASNDIQPKLLSEMRVKHEKERQDISDRLDEIETGQEQGVLAELEEEAGKISDHRQALKSQAGGLRKKLAESLNTAQIDSIGTVNMADVELRHLPSYAAYENAYHETRDALVKLTSRLFCAVAFVFSVVPVVLTSFMVESWALFDLSNGITYALAYIVVLLSVVLLIIATVTYLLSKRARDAYDQLRLEAIDLVRDVKELPNYVYRYARLTGTSASFRVIEKELLERAQDKAQSILERGFDDLKNYRPKDVDALKATEDYQNLQGVFDDRNSVAGYLRPFELMSRNPLMDTTHDLTLSFGDSFAIHEPQRILSSGIRSQGVTIERLYP